jgi:hypothetical protein
MDPEVLFANARHRLRRLRPLGAQHQHLILVLGSWPARRVAEGWWEPLDPRAARERDECLILAVRGGALADLRPAPGIAYDPVHGHPLGDGWALERGWLALAGPDILDLLALDWELRRPPLRLTGMAYALGDASGVLVAEWPEPVRLVRDAREWLALARQGAVLPLGDDAQAQSYLRSLTGGIVVTDTEQGRAVKRLLERELPKPPPLFVAQQEEGRAA